MAQRITRKHRLLAWAVLSTLSNSEAVLHRAHAAELNTKVPTVAEASGFPVQINLPVQPLNQSIRQLANQTGLSISFDSEVTKNKTAPAVKGFLSPQEALKKVLQGSGLQLNISGDSAVIKPEPEKNSQSLKLDAVEVRAKRFYEVGPLPGLGLTKEEIPGNVQSISAKEIKEAHSLSITDLMNRKLQSVTVNDYQGNPFMMDVQYRGFTAGPQFGTPQGLSVFLDGIRVNEPFGDIVNWDMIPMNALASLDVFPGSNPIFGRNTLGGALSMKTKDGFENAGADAEILTGSFGRKQLQVEGGWNNGTVGLFAAGNFFLEDGWRKNSPSKVNQLFTKASFRGDKLDLNLSTLLVETNLVGNGLIPSQMYEQDRNGVFTSPDTTKNRLDQFQLSGSYFVNDNFSVTAQAYRRNSRRQQKNADVYTEYGSQTVNRNLKQGEQFTCLFKSTNPYNLPDYYVIDLPNNNFFDNEFVADWFTRANDPGFQLNLNLANGNPADPDVKTVADSFNQQLPDYFVAHAQAQFNYFKSPYESLFYQSDYTNNLLQPGQETSYSSGEASYTLNSDGGNFGYYFAMSADDAVIGGPKSGFSFFQGTAFSYYYTEDGTKHVIAFLESTNAQNCLDTQNSNQVGGPGSYLGELDPVTQLPKTVNGQADIESGTVEGTPTAVITDNEINQKVDGASFQLNWNLDKHKLMIGGSIDKTYAEYGNAQRLGFFDSNRNGYLDPDAARDQYAAADIDVRNNDFDGSSITKSLYVSETWTPIESVHITGALRYNDTSVRNSLAARTFGETSVNLSYFANNPYFYDICPNGNCDGVLTGNRPPDLSRVIGKPETEKFSYYSLNPSLGFTWQAKENINTYFNWSQGTRTPSVIELGCALDKTPIQVGVLNGQPIYVPISVAQGRSCQLPSGLSGDPYLPQVKAETFDLGVRGTLSENIEWNLGYYRTDLKDDIYMVTYPGNRNFFDSVGRTRRQGIEMGMRGTWDNKLRFGLNYSLTDARFRDTFEMAGDDNSSATQRIDILELGSVSGIMTVEPGDRMPGVSLHNMNANVSYDLTDKWTVGLSAVAHSSSFLRGNENNDHRSGVAKAVVVPNFVPNSTGTGYVYAGTKTVYRQPSNNPGKIPGYVTFNFQTSYKLGKEWTATMLVNNLFDKEYFSAGRLGLNPFSPSINGAIGPDGYNHNSNDWLSTNFVAPGAPRGVWFSLNWHFVPD